MKELLTELVDCGKKTGVVSSASSWMVEQILEQFKLSSLFDIVINGEQVKRHKPDPEPYLLALETLSLPGSEVLIFEDSQAGLQAARAAKCDAIAVKHEFNINNDLSEALTEIDDYSAVMDMLLCPQ